MPSTFKIAIDPEEDESQVNRIDKAPVNDIKQEQTLTTWETQKENIQPISQGRKIDTLMQALTLLDDKESRQKLFDLRKEQFDNDLKANADDASRRLNCWNDYIDWLEQNVPDGGKVNNITNAIEQCIELYYDKKEFKQDKRLFNIFMKFKRFCDEPTEIFGFMYANSICTLLARFYLSWSWQYEIKKNMKRAEDLIKLGLKNLASPREELLEAQTQLRARIDRLIRAGELDDCPDSGPLNNRETQEELASRGIRAALQTLKFRVTKKNSIRVPINRIGSAVDQQNVGGLKSQTKLVNGIRVAKTSADRKATVAKTTTGMAPGANKPVQVFADSENADGGVIGDENDENRLPMMAKIPTSQRIRMVGRSGRENQMPKSGSLSMYR